MDTNAPIVVAVDGSAASDAAAGWAAQEAALQSAPLRMVFVLDRQEYYIPGIGNFTAGIDFAQTPAEFLEATAAKAAEAAAQFRDIDITTELLVGSVVPALLTESKNARLVVVGNRGLGSFGSRVLGSVSSALATHARCPVAVIRANTSLSRSGPVVVGVDGTANSEPAIAVAFEEASRRGASLVAVHAWSDVSESLVFSLDWTAVETAQDAAMAQSLAGWQEKYPDVNVQRIVVRSAPARELHQHSLGAQLLVVGSHGRGGFAGMLLGSTSRSLLHTADCPVLIVRSPSS